MRDGEDVIEIIIQVIVSVVVSEVLIAVKPGYVVYEWFIVVVNS